MSVSEKFNGDEVKLLKVEDYDFTNAPLFRKTATVSVEAVQIAQEQQEVITLQTGANGDFVETKNTAQAGDYIVTRSPGDSYVITAAKFPKLYEINPDNPTEYRSKNVGKAIQISHDFAIDASWGERQNIKAGGVLFLSFGDTNPYGNQKTTFEADFGRQGIDGSVMPLSKPLSEQLEWAKELGELAHIKDIVSRMEQEDLASAAKLSSAAPVVATANDKI